MLPTDTLDLATGFSLKPLKETPPRRQLLAPRFDSPSISFGLDQIPSLFRSSSLSSRDPNRDQFSGSFRWRPQDLHFADDFTKRASTKGQDCSTLQGLSLSEYRVLAEAITDQSLDAILVS